ncbi:hypothetical protein DFH08DRAFT_487191 [Mycena albidolilacea]|uniref:Uncharacterized protein n=1 Tax=Mycena albidolilacea TaxID=1033008 RepID=A0AAD6Z6E4_9AGAR|nr:hypothetical protein DFH08DRAFT_487191 [Mycena albidolilacea]
METEVKGGQSVSPPLSSLSPSRLHKQASSFHLAIRLTPSPSAPPRAFHARISPVEALPVLTLLGPQDYGSERTTAPRARTPSCAESQMYWMRSARRRTCGYPTLSCVSAPSVGTAAQPREIRGGRGRGRQTARRRRAENARRRTAHGVQAGNSPLSVSSAVREMGGGEATRAIALLMGSLAFRKAAAPPQIPITARGAFRGGGGWARGQRKEGGEGSLLRDVSRVRTEANKHGMDWGLVVRARGTETDSSLLRVGCVVRFEIKCSCAARWT